jgi:2-methylcitrate dehydratase PrpD
MVLTHALGAFVASLDPVRIPAQALHTARMGLIDCVGVMIAGRDEDAPQILRRTLAPAGGEATLYFSGLRAPAPEAAWINGTAAHALDFDDVALRGHPSTVLVPAILAEAEALGSSGAEMLTAYVAGYECWAELVRRERGFHHSKGWHPTGIFGAIAAAAACAKLRGLDAGKATMAIALGASQSAGLMANFGTMTKPFHAGRSAHAGLMAARLADAGFTASPDALEHPQGFLAAVSQHGEVDREEEASALGREWRILTEGLSIKKFPTCYCTHRSIDGMLQLVSENSFALQDVQAITVHMSDRHATILRNHRPKTGLEAKFSAEFAMAAAIIMRRVGLPELTDAFVQRPDVQALIARTTVAANQDYDPEMPAGARFDKVEVRLASGQVIEGPEIRRARGHASIPLSEAELLEKFQACLEVGGMSAQADALFDQLRNIDRTPARQLALVA